jgi:putative ABC transport system permease protein
MLRVARRVVAGMRALLRRDQVDQDLDEELQAYLEAAIDRHVAAGMSREAATRVARIELGSTTVVKQHVREAGWESRFDAWTLNLRDAWRALRRAPGVALIAIGTLSMGIGGTTVMFSAVDSVLLRPLPYPQPDHLVWVWGQLRGGPQRASVNPLEYRDYREQGAGIVRLAAFANFAQTGTLTRRGTPESLPLSIVSGNYFDVLGVHPVVGRPLTLADEEAGRTDVAVISFALWSRHFGSDPAVIDSVMALDDRAVRIVGVMPAGFRPPQPAEIWMPLDVGQIGSNRRAHFLRPIGRLESGVTREQAQAALDVIAKRLEQQYPATSAGWGLLLEPVDQQLVRNLRTPIWVLFGAVACFLFMACANVAGLLQARATARSPEIAVRSALGASRGRIVAQLLTESLLLAVIACALGLLLANWALQGLLALDALRLPPWVQISLDGRVLAFALAITVGTTLLFGSLPAWEVSRTNLADSLKAGVRTIASGHRSMRTRGALVVAQVAVTVVLLVGAGLMLRTLIGLRQIDPGFASSTVLSVRIELPVARYREPQRQIDFFDEIQRRIRAIPEITAVGMTSQVPLSGQMNDVPFRVTGREAGVEGLVTVDFRSVNHDYLRAMSIPLLHGRAFGEDEARRSAPVALISEGLAERFFPNQNPLGQQVRAGDLVAEVVGIVGNVRHRSLSGAYYPTMYVPSLARPATNLLVRTSGRSPAELAPAVQAAIASLDKNLALSAVQPLDSMLDASISRPRFNAVLMNGFAALALFIALAGIYGLVSFTVHERAREIALRLALGATRGTIRSMFLRSGLKLAAIGAALGMIGAIALSQVVRGLLFNVDPIDPTTYAAIAALLGATVLAACWLPARRAASLSPLIATRGEQVLSR